MPRQLRRHRRCVGPPYNVCGSRGFETPASRKRNSSASGMRCNKLGNSPCSASVERQPYPTGKRAPEHGERLPIVSRQFGRLNKEAPVWPHAGSQPFRDKSLHLLAQIAGATREIEQRGVDLRIGPAERGQQIVPNPIAKELARRIARVVDPGGAAVDEICSKRRAPKRHERTQDCTGRIQTRQPARAAAAHDAHQHRFHLIVLGVRGNDTGAEGCRGLAEESVPRVSPRGLAPINSHDHRRDMTHDCGKAERRGQRRHRTHSARGARARAVIECRDRRDLSARHDRHRAQKRHGVEPAGDGEQ